MAFPLHFYLWYLQSINWPPTFLSLSGFYDAQTEGSFYWADCVTSSSGFADWNWNLTQPDNANGNEDCTVLLGANEPGYYADFPCTREVKYICEEVQEDKCKFPMMLFCHLKFDLSCVWKI